MLNVLKIKIVPDANLFIVHLNKTCMHIALLASGMSWGKKESLAITVRQYARELQRRGHTVAIISEKAFLSLEAPPLRITGYDTVIPLPKMENHYFPDAERIAKGIMEAVRY